jgi:hypothetical protein
MEQIQAWIPTIVSVISGAVAIAIAHAVTKTRVDGLSEDKKEVQKHLEAASKELQEAVKAIAILSREQAVINQVTATALQAVTRRLESHDEKLSQLDGTVRLLTELVKRLEKINVE